jgi:hypothetical protein
MRGEMNMKETPPMQTTANAAPVRTAPVHAAFASSICETATLRVKSY